MLLDDLIQEARPRPRPAAAFALEYFLGQQSTTTSDFDGARSHYLGVLLTGALTIKIYVEKT